MFFRVIILLVLVLSYLQSIAQYEVIGSLTNISIKEDPLDNHPVYFYIENQIIDTVFTNTQGSYSFYYEGELSGTLYVKTVGFCDTWHVYVDSVIRNLKDISIVDFEICHENSADACLASFEYEHVDSVTINFLANYNLEGLMNYEWDFGDEQNGSSIQNPQYQYADQGIYTVQLITTNPMGCTDTSSNEVLVSEDTYIRGKLSFPGNTLYDGYVQLINIEDNSIEQVGYANEEGNYEIWCNPDNYVLKVVPDLDFDDYLPRVLPTYYGSTINWQDAIAITNEHEIKNVDIQALTSYFVPNGGNIINVKLEASVNLNLLPIDVYLLDEDQNPIDFGVEIEPGRYRFDGVPAGVYYIKPESPGRYSSPLLVEFELTNENPIFTEFIVTSTQINPLGVEDLRQNDERFTAYPVPIKEFLNISSELAVSKVHITDASGRVISVNEYSLENNCRLSTQYLPRGIYFVTVFYDNQAPGCQKIVK